MPANYTLPDAILVDTIDHNPVLTLLAPACYSALSFLTACGHGPVTNQCVIHHENGNSETNSFVSPDWLGGSLAAFSAHGRVSVSTKLVDHLDTEGPQLYAVDVPVAETDSPVTTVVLSQITAGPSAHSVVLAVSGIASGLPPLTRPVLQITTSSDGTLTLHSTQPGRLESCTSLCGAEMIWKDEGALPKR
jgi:hypothetical protein